MRNAGLDPMRLWRAGRRSFNGVSVALQRRLLRKRYFERGIHDYRLLLDSADPGINRQLLRGGAREPEQKYVLERHLRRGMYALDLGANIGYYTVMMARLVGEQGRIYAVEPHPDNYALLSANVRRNRVTQVAMENVAIDVQDAQRPLLTVDHCNWHSFHDPRITTDAPWKSHYRRRMKEPVLVRTRALSRYLEDKPQLDLLRMDLEGYEVEILDALAALPSSLTRRLHILMETHPEFYHPRRHDMRAVLQRLHERHGYRVKYLISDCQHGSRRMPHLQPAMLVLQRHGYGPRHILKMFDSRAIYMGVAMRDAIELICTSENVHAVFLEPTDV